MYKAIAINKRNTVIVIIAFLILIGAISFFIGYYLYEGNYFIPIFALIITAFYVLFQYFVAGNIAMLINSAHEINRKDYPDLWNSVENITISEGMPMPKVYVIRDSAPNAFAAGRNPKKSMVAVTTGLLEIVDKRELTSIVAHEMGHIKNYDILVATIVFGLVSVISIICDLLFRVILFGGRGSDNKNIVVLIIGLVALILAPFIALIIRMAVSRQREYLADATSALITRDSEGMIKALEKLRDNSRPMSRQNTSTAHLFMVNPLKSDGFMSKIFSTHPPIKDRIARLEKNARRM